jgi:TetR/AcrR family transcriptional regulator, repressor for neighboring sulfatase
VANTPSGADRPGDGPAEPKGRAAVEEALTAAAAELLAERGPRATGVREIAARAGVNHGQIHHYFGGKGPLLRAAMHRLAAEHQANATTRAGGGPFPPALTVGRDVRYWQAVIRAVLDGDLDLAATEVADGLSVPRRALVALAEAHGLDAPDTDLKARTAASVCLQLAWEALEPFVFLVTDVEPHEEETVRRYVADLAVRVPLERG